MSAPRLWPGRLWIIGYALGLGGSILSWAATGSAFSAFFAGANGVFLLWAITDRLDAEVQRLNTELARHRIEARQ